MIKFSRALYYRHTKSLFDGKLYLMRINGYSENFKKGKFEPLLSRAPVLELPKRGKEVLHDQFIYRYSASGELGALHAIVQFSSQMIFQIIAIQEPLATELARLDTPALLAARIDAPLIQRS